MLYDFVASAQYADDGLLVDQDFSRPDRSQEAKFATYGRDAFALLHDHTALFNVTANFADVLARPDGVSQDLDFLLLFTVVGLRAQDRVFDHDHGCSTWWQRRTCRDPRNFSDIQLRLLTGLRMRDADDREDALRTGHHHMIGRDDGVAVDNARSKRRDCFLRRDILCQNRAHEVFVDSRFDDLGCRGVLRYLGQCVVYGEHGVGRVAISARRPRAGIVRERRPIFR